MPIKNILCLTDFTNLSAKALYYASNLASGIHADVVVMHWYDFPFQYSGAPADAIIAMQDALKEEAESKVQALIHDASRISPNVHFTYDLELGYMSEYLTEVVRRRAIDLIVMGTGGAKGISDFLFGTNTGHMIETAPCPVLVIPEDAEYSPVRNIVVASEFKLSELVRLRYVAEIAQSLHAKITIAHVGESPDVDLLDNYKKEVKRAIDYDAIEFCQLLGSKINKCISDYASQEDMDWIVMSMSHRTLLAKLFARNLTKEMSYYSQIPLLTFHE